MTYAHTHEANAEVHASPDQLFAHLDDPARLGAHMERPSMMMMGGRMTYEFDEAKGRAGGSIIKMGGSFLGIRVDGQLVAMAGERMKPAHYTEMTAVCVHPSHRGRGYGQMLLSAVSRQIVSRGEIPFLHVFTSNHSAIALYRRQGMEIRRRLHVTVLKKED
jgi:predicted GNAT family acetyltransferase